jgi:hypothetical protein
MAEIEHGKINPDKLGSVSHEDEHSPAPQEKV